MGGPVRRTRQYRGGRRRSLEARARRAGSAFARLVRVMDTLRSARGCPWDRQQTHETLRPFIIEEAYELIDAIDRGDTASLPGELGDVLFQCVFHAQIASEAGRFDIADSVTAMVAKLVRRHPHVFLPSGRRLPRGTTRLGSSEAVLEQWEQIKAREQVAAGKKKRVLTGIPRAMPALVRAHEIGTRVAAVGFDWPTTAAVIDKVDEEVAEVKAALASSPDRAAEELGDLLFAIVNLARKLGLDAEAVLRAANDKFTARFEAIEAALERRGRTVHEATLDELEAEWQRVKKMGNG